MAIARVEPLTTARALRGPFDYALPERLGDVGVGSVLLVPFGPRRLLGVVVDVADSSELDPSRLVEPVRAIAAGVSPELVRLGLWVAHEYCSTAARGLELVLPPGTVSRGSAAKPKLELRAEITPAGGAALDGAVRLGARQRDVLAQLDGAGREVPSGELGADRAALRRLEKRGFVALREVEVRRRPEVPVVGARSGPVELNPDQRRAVKAIVAGLDGPGGELLLHGVTGSGKTEVYLAAAEAALERGRGVIALVPEIALTPQTLGRFRSRLGERVALLHSRLSAGERRDEWTRLRSGEARVAVGPRSAAFAPVAALGLVIVDEEHEPSYKQEGDPRYDAREVARHRAAAAGAVMVAGTATPRPESWHALRRLELPRRADDRPLPPVEVLDMRARSGAGGPLHPRTREELRQVAATGGKAIVLVNRRGWAPFLDCRSCGRGFGCPECDVSLVVHSSELRCHHCGHREAVPGACDECGSVTLAQHGAGTEQAERVVSELVAPMPVFRLDSDTASGTGAHAEILSRFDRAQSGVLIGTQMVAKGHDFPDVTLGVVLDADASLRFPDFRAEERTFSLIAQLAGRSGRGPAGGRVLVQTLAPEADAIRHAARHDAATFLEGELERRRALAYPPFAHLVRVELTAPDEAAAQAAAELLAARLTPALPTEARLLGPAPRFRRRGRYRRQLLVKSGERAPAVAAIRDVVDGAVRELRGGGVAVSVDPDPS
ncbi:MAG: replication restart helicase PriA [Solirubrobacterales bacterium]